MFGLRLLCPVAGAVILILESCSSGSARDLPKLASVLARVFLAENFAAICELHGSGFLKRAGGPLGTIHAYSQHMKNEVIAPLGASEAERVLTLAARSARDLARSTLRGLNDGAGRVDEQRLETWCALPAASYVREIISEHDKHHSRFTQAVAAATGE